MTDQEYEFNDKKIIYAEGVMKHFDIDNDRPSLYFDGNVINESDPIKRNIKLSKRVAGYRTDSRKQLAKNEFPKKDDIYKVRLMLETWEWENHQCKRVLAFELVEYLGKNSNYSDGEIINPFDFIRRTNV